MTVKPNPAQIALEDALTRVEAGASFNDRKAIEDALARVLERGEPFTSEAIIAELGDVYPTIREPRLLGAVIRIAVRAGEIKPTGRWVNGLRAKRHSAPVREWRPR